MTKINNSISGTSSALLKSLIGRKLLWFLHDEFLHSNSVFQRIGICTEDGWYILDNRVDWFDDFYTGKPEFAPHFIFEKADKESELHIEGDKLRPLKFPVDQILSDIILVQDHIDVFRKGNMIQHLDSTEGVVFVFSSGKKYAFFKDNTWLDETVNVFQGYDVMERIEPLEQHWHIMDHDDYSTKKTREIINLSGN